MWVKLDDAFPEHRKLFKAGGQLGRFGVARAIGVYIEGLCYAARNLTDGFLPTRIIAGLRSDPTPKEVARVLARADVGLWEASDGGYQIHDYHHYNPAAREVKTKRERDRKRKQFPQGFHADSVGIPERSRARDPVPSRPVKREDPPARDPTLPAVPPPAKAPAARARGRTDEKTGHRQHVFCGTRFCVPQFLAEEHRQQLGHLAASVDLATQYLAWDRELGDEPVRSPKAYLASQVAGLIRRVGPVPRGAAPTSPDVWSDVMDVLTDRLTRYELSTWFAGTRLLVASSNRLVVSIDNQAKADWIHRHYADQLAAAIAAVRPGAEVVFQAERTDA